MTRADNPADITAYGPQDIERMAAEMRAKAKAIEPAAVVLDYMARLEETDGGNAERFILAFGDGVRYCAELGGFLVDSGTHWRVDPAAVHARAAQLWRIVIEEARVATDEKEARRLLEHAKRTRSAKAVRDLLAIVQHDPRIAIEPSKFDADDYLLNVQNGVVDLRTGELRQRRPGELFTMVAAADYVPDADTSLWAAMIAMATGGDPTYAAFLQRWAGYTATGDTKEEKLALLHGPTRANKSTTAESIRAALGTYAKVADFEAFLQRNGAGGPRNDIARLRGARMVVSIEVDEGARLAQGLLKSLTGGDTVTARMLYRESFEFLPRFKLWLVANHAPRTRDDDGALWRRIMLLPFEHTIPEDMADPTIKARLKDPAIGGPAVLRWMIQGALDWQRHGLGVPERVTVATGRYREDQDPLRVFAEDCLVFVPQAWTSVRRLREAYETWARDVGERFTLGPRTLAERLEARGCREGQRREHGKAARGWQGVGLRADCPGVDTSTHVDTSTDNSLHARAGWEVMGNGVDTRRHVDTPNPNGHLPGLDPEALEERRAIAEDGAP